MMLSIASSTALVAGKVASNTLCQPGPRETVAEK